MCTPARSERDRHVVREWRVCEYMIDSSAVPDWGAWGADCFCEYMLGRGGFGVLVCEHMMDYRPPCPTGGRGRLSFLA